MLFQEKIFELFLWTSISIFRLIKNERDVSGNCKIMINLCQADLGIYTPEGMTGKIVMVMILKIATQTKNRYVSTINSSMTSS